MKYARFWLFLGLLVPGTSFAVVNPGFQSAAQLLSAARRGDTRTVQQLINSGANVNYVDSTGISLVCTAVMNNDKRAIQILQMYGADASNCDKQIKQYRQRAKVAASGEEYGFFSGLSSSHVVALSALGVAGVIGGVSLLSNIFDDDNGNRNGSSSSGSRGDESSGGQSGSATKSFTVPYGPAYLDAVTGKVNPSNTEQVDKTLAFWDSDLDTMYGMDFRYLMQNTANNYISDHLNGSLQNYLLVMGGYYSMANGYMGQYIFRDKDAAYAPILPAASNRPQSRPVGVALITGNGINPAGSADSGDGIFYAMDTTASPEIKHVDKYLNNHAEPITGSQGQTDGYDLIEQDVKKYDLSGSGSAFNPFANVNDSALAKIVAGWESGIGSDARSYADLYGFVPNGQLAIYRTGNGKIWNNVSGGAQKGTFADGTSGDGVLSDGDTIVIDGNTYTIKKATDPSVASSISGKPTITINRKSFVLANASKMLVAKCTSDPNLSNIAIYVGSGTDTNWYVNTTGGNDIDEVWAVDLSNNIYVKKQQEQTGYANFTAIKNAVTKTYSFPPSTTSTPVDVIANTNVIPNSRKNSYVTTNTFEKYREMSNQANNTSLDSQKFYGALVTSEYDVYNGPEGSENQGNIAYNVFLGYSSDNPMLIMPAGDYTVGISVTDSGNNPVSSEVFLNTLDATFENYAPLAYTNLNHNFMTVVGVSHSVGTSDATSVTDYGYGINDDYGKIILSAWSDSVQDTSGNTTTTVYGARMCGLAGVGDASSSVDPWCFAASGPTAEMATASAAGAVASVKSAFSYMTNDQIFTLLALTADGPYLNTTTDGVAYSIGDLVDHLNKMYELPADVIAATGKTIDVLITKDYYDEYLDLFKRVFGYGLINLRRAIKPGFSVYYYDANKKSIVSASGKTNGFWGNVSNSSRASSVFALGGRASIKTSFFDVLESIDGSMSLPRIWNTTIAIDSNTARHGLYMGDVLGDFNVDSTNKHTNKIGNLTFDMSVSQRAYNDNMNGLDNMRIAWSNDKFDLTTEYQHYLTNGESRFNSRANGLLGLASNVISASAMYKTGGFGFGGHGFFGTITDENLLEKDPVVTSQFEPGKLGLANGGAMDAQYKSDKFALNMSFGMMHEDNTVLGTVTDGMLAMDGANTKYVDALATYKPFDNVKLSLRGTFADTHANANGVLITEMSNLKSNAFALGVDVYGLEFTAAMPLAVVDGKMGYGYADYTVVENNGKYEIAVNNPHTEYIDLSAQKRELRFTTTYKHSFGEWTNAGVGFVYRVNPNNIDMFGNESILMFKIHHRLGI